MTFKQTAARAYGNAQRETASDHNIELQLFSSITARLKTHLPTSDQSLSLTAPLAEALVDNAKLWSILMIDLLSEANTLDLSLKTSLIQLSEFTQAHTHKVLRGEVGIDALIDVNVAIINGLKAGIQYRTAQNTKEVA